MLLVAGAGYGKTTAIEEAISLSARRSIWVACGDAGGEAGRLLVATAEALRAAVPGLADVLADRLAAGVEPVDVRAAGAALVRELGRLLVEPLVIVFDDAEELEESAGDARAARRAARRSRHAALARHREPAPARAAAREAARRRASARARPGGAQPHPGRMRADPVAAPRARRHPRGGGGRDGRQRGLADGRRADSAHRLARGGNEGRAPRRALPLPRGGGARPARSRDAVGARGFERARLAHARRSPPSSSCPAEFIERAAELGLFLRSQPAGGSSYHPLFRSFLLEQLQELRSEDERARLHERTASALAAGGRQAAAIEHWMAAGRFDEALAALGRHIRELVRTSPGAVSEWLEQIPSELRGEPAYRLLQGYRLWAAGRHEEALPPLRQTAEIYRSAGDEGREWVARLMLADALLSEGAFREVADVVEGWDEVSDPDAAQTAAGVAWYEVIALGAYGMRDEARALAERLRADSEGAARFASAGELAGVGIEPAAGLSRELLARLHTAVAELEREDTYGSLPYYLSMVTLVRRDLGEYRRRARVARPMRARGRAARAGLRGARLRAAALLPARPRRRAHPGRARARAGGRAPRHGLARGAPPPGGGTGGRPARRRASGDRGGAAGARPRAARSGLLPRLERRRHGARTRRSRCA